MVTTTRNAPAAGGRAPLVAPSGLDHVNLYVRDVERSLLFYTEVLGLPLRGVLRRDDAGRPTFVALAAGPDTIFLMHNPDYAPPADARTRGLNHLCLLIPPTDPEQLLSDLRARGVTIRRTREGSRATREGSRAAYTGAQDPRKTFSVYVEDPDGHGIELEQIVAGQ